MLWGFDGAGHRACKTVGWRGHKSGREARVEGGLCYLAVRAALGTQGGEKVAEGLRGCPRVFLAFDSDDAGLEATERLAGLLGRRAAAVTLPQDVGDVAELAALPHGRAVFLRLLAQAARSAR